MQSVLERYRAMLEPKGSGGDTAYERGAHSARYADDAHALLPGTWFMSGHHQGREEIDALWEAVRRMWPKGTRLFRNHFFVGEDTIAVEWWSRNEIWNGVQAQNSGVGRLRFRGEQVIDHHEVTDSEYFEEIHGDWRGAVGPEIGAHLPLWSRRTPPFYPDPAQNDWALDHSPTDGSAQVPEALQDVLRRTRTWWENPDCEAPPFANDVEIFFQGRLWPLGGRHRGRAGWQRVREVANRLWSDVHFPRLNFWAGDDRVLVEWFCERTLFDGRRCRDGGFSVWHWQDDAVVSVRNYVDTSLYAEVLTGWRDVVGEALGRELPNWEAPGTPRYPNPSGHE